jgi:hypothetical protein
MNLYHIHVSSLGTHTLLLIPDISSQSIQSLRLTSAETGGINWVTFFIVNLYCDFTQRIVKTYVRQAFAPIWPVKLNGQQARLVRQVLSV